MKERFWEKFTQTGRVEDYLSYKGMAVCQDVMEKYAKKKQDKETETHMLLKKQQ